MSTKSLQIGPNHLFNPGGAPGIKCCYTIYPWAVYCEGPPSFIWRDRGGGGELKNEALLFQSTVDIHFQNALNTHKTAKASTLCVYFDNYVLFQFVLPGGMKCVAIGMHMLVFTGRKSTVEDFPIPSWTRNVLLTRRRSKWGQKRPHGRKSDTAACERALKIYLHNWL